MKLTQYLAGFTSVALLVVGLVAFLPDSASATTCMPTPELSKESAERALKDSTAVFSGEVIKKEEVHKTVTWGDNEQDTAPVTKVTLRTSEVWKGPKRETIVVFTGNLFYPAIPYTFEKGQGYLVFAQQSPYDNLSLFVDGCGETMPISEPDNIKALWLADTSGIVPGSGVLGLAGLTATAAFLLMRRLLKIR
jgi:hypothetical protein